jgi:hypothetical protein
LEISSNSLGGFIPTFQRVPNTLRGDLIQSWFYLGFAAFVSSTLVICLLILTEHKNQISRALDDLSRKAPLITRRISGELLIGSSGFLVLLFQI